MPDRAETTQYPLDSPPGDLPGGKDQEMPSLSSVALRQSPYSPRAKQRFSGCSASPHPTLSLRTRWHSQNPRLPLAAGAALSSSLWEAAGPVMAMVMKVGGGVKALAG